MRNSSARQNYKDFSDEKLADLSRSDDSSAFSELILRYVPVVNSRASGYYAGGLDPEDLAQEGMIGLVRAIRGYDSEKGASFRTFALLCIDRCIISSVRSVLSSGKIPASTILSIDSSDGDSLPVEMTLSDDEPSPEDIVISTETVKSAYKELENILSHLEAEVFKLYLGGCGYDTIAKRLSISKKKVDNALCRAKGKLKSIDF